MSSKKFFKILDEFRVMSEFKFVVQISKQNTNRKKKYLGRGPLAAARCAYCVAVLPRAALNGAQELPISYLTLITSVRN
jgi:hypothetical protein